MSPSRNWSSSWTRPSYSSWVDVADARRRALLDVRVEARPAEPLVAVELALGAGADRERAQQQVERLPDRVGVRERPEVADALALAAPQHHRPRPLLVEGDREVRVGLVVLQPDVEAGLVLLDEVELEEERLDLVARRRSTRRCRRSATIWRVRSSSAGAEVVRQPAAQALRLADVDDPALGVEELVRPRRVGDAADGSGPAPCPIVAAATPVAPSAHDQLRRDGVTCRWQRRPGIRRTYQAPRPTTPRCGDRAVTRRPMTEPIPRTGRPTCCVSRLRCRTTTPSRHRTSSSAGSRAAKADARRPAPDPRPPLPARRGDPLGRPGRRLVQARPLRGGQPPGHRHRVLRRALHGRVGRRAHRPTTSG